MVAVKKNSEIDPYYLPLPERLREMLNRKGETQAKLADAISVSRQAVGQWKDGITTPDAHTLGKIADYYGVSTDYLLGRIEVESPDLDIIEIHNKTGLSEDAINAIIWLRDGDSTYEEFDLMTEPLIKVLNVLLENEQFVSILAKIRELYLDAENMEAYLQAKTNPQKPGTYKLDIDGYELGQVLDRFRAGGLRVDPETFYSMEENHIMNMFRSLVGNIMDNHRRTVDCTERVKARQKEFENIQRDAKKTGHKLP